MAHVVATFAQMERERIGERTREGMAEIKAKTGKHMGRPVTLAPATAARIRELHASGLSLEAIADRLTAGAVPTARRSRAGTVSLSSCPRTTRSCIPATGPKQPPSIQSATSRPTFGSSTTKRTSGYGSPLCQEAG